MKEMPQLDCSFNKQVNRFIPSSAGDICKSLCRLSSSDAYRQYIGACIVGLIFCSSCPPRMVSLIDTFNYCRGLNERVTDGDDDDDGGGGQCAHVCGYCGTHEVWLDAK